MNRLQKALKINALFSSISGLIMILLKQLIANVFGTTNTTVFWGVGLVLIFFAVTIWYEIKKQRKLAVLWIVTQDFLWVIGSLYLILFNPFKVTGLGNLIIGVVALIVLFMGINQANALKNNK